MRGVCNLCSQRWKIISASFSPPALCYPNCNACSTFGKHYRRASGLWTSIRSSDPPCPPQAAELSLLRILPPKLQQPWGPKVVPLVNQSRKRPQVALPENRSRKIDGLAGSPPCMGCCNIFQPQHDDNYNRRDALNIMGDLPSSWPSCRLCINADAVATSYLAGLHRLFLEAKLAEKDHQTALQEANARAYEMETICLDPLARHLHQLFHTDDDLFFDVYPEEWKQLQRLDFWQLSLMRIRRLIDKSMGKVNLPQKTIEGVVHLQPRLHAPVDSLPTLIVIVTFPVTYLKVVLLRLPPLQSTVVAPQTKHVQDVQRVRMGSEALPFVVPLPDCPRVQTAFCAGLLHPEGADRAIPLPSIKYGLEVVVPTLAEIPTSQALLKEEALLQPAKHPLLPGWQVTLVQHRRSLVRMKPIKLPEPSSRSPKPKQIPYTLPFEPTLHALSSDELRRIYVEGRPVKATNGASPGRRLNSLLRLTSSSESTTTSTRSLPRPEWGKNPDHWTGQQWSQRTRNAGWVEGWHQSASSSSSRWHS